jgi:hypothetical protein
LEHFYFAKNFLELDARSLLRLRTDGPSFWIAVFVGYDNGTEPSAIRLPLVDRTFTVHPFSGHD